MKKKYLTGIAALCLAMLLGACGGADENVRGTISDSKEVVESTDDKQSTASTDGSETPDAETSQEEGPSVSLGTSSNNVYENAFLGIGCKLSSDWTFATDEEIMENNQLTQDMVGDEYKAVLENAAVISDMFASHSNGMDSVNVNLEKLNLGALAITEEQYCEASVDALEGALSSMGLNVKSIETSTMTFAGSKHACIIVEGEFEGVSVYETLVTIRQGNYMSCITACTWYDNTISDILDAFYAL